VCIAKKNYIVMVWLMILRLEMAYKANWCVWQVYWCVYKWRTSSCSRWGEPFHSIHQSCVYVGLNRILQLRSIYLSAQCSVQPI